MEEELYALNASNQRLLKDNENLMSQLEEVNFRLKNKENEYVDLINPIQDIMYRISTGGNINFIMSCPEIVIQKKYFYGRANKLRKTNPMEL